MVDLPPFTAIIPARGGSKGIPDKNIREFCGKPLLAWSIEQAFQAGAESVCVSTDSLAIAGIAKSFGAVSIERPGALSTDESPSELAIKHAIEYLSLEGEDLVVFLQATSPVRHAKAIEQCVELVATGLCDSVFSAVRIDDLTVWRQTNGQILEEVNLQEGRERLPRQKRNAIYVENGSVYCFRVDSFRISGNRTHGRVGQVPVEPYCLPEIDSAEDWEHCQTLMEKFILKEGIN